MDEFITQCEQATNALIEIARKYLCDNNFEEYNRLIAKIDGIDLAKSYYIRLKNLQ